MKFIYNFKPSGTVSDFTGRVKTYAVVENPGKWKKDILLDETTTSAPTVSTRFYLNLEEIRELINDIEQDIDIRTSTYDITIEARVRMLAKVGTIEINDAFIHPLKVELTSNTLRFAEDLTLTDSKLSQGVNYEHLGQYDYTIRLEENTLFEVNTLKPPPPSTEGPMPSSATVTVGPGEVLFSKIIDSMEMSYSYRFVCDQQLQSVNEELEITAVLENPGMWSKSYVLVPPTAGTGRLDVDFPLDIAGFAQEASDIAEELGTWGGSHELTVTATVHTIAQSAFGPIDDTLTQTLTVKLGGPTLELGELTRSESGSIKGTIVVANEWAQKARPWSLVIMVLIMIGSGYLMGVVFRVRPLRLIAKPSPTEREAIQAKKRHKDIITEVPELPTGRAWETVVPISTLEDLVKIADGLGKVVLHYAGREQHTYYVIEGMVRYEYVSAPFSADSQA
jgi:hypothetical protein